MLVSEESVAVLEAEVAEALSILEELPAENDKADQEKIGLVIRRYVAQVERISSTAGEAGFSGLQDTCLLFQENLTALETRGQGLSDAERERLEEWPVLVIGYLMSPNDPQASEALLDHLQSVVWNTPLSAAEAHVLRDLLAPAELLAEQGQEVSGEAHQTPAPEEVSAALPEGMEAAPIQVEIGDHSPFSTPSRENGEKLIIADTLASSPQWKKPHRMLLLILLRKKRRQALSLKLSRKNRQHYRRYKRLLNPHWTSLSKLW